MTLTPTNNNIHNNPCPARSLVLQLEGDFDGHNTTHGTKQKRSCRDCLRSKAMPCHQVVELLSNNNNSNNNSTSNPNINISRETLLQAHSMLLHNMDDWTFTFTTTTTTTIKEQQSSLWYMNRIVTISRFIQLLFSLKPATLLPPEQTNQLVSTLLASWSKKLRPIIDDHNHHNHNHKDYDDDDDDYDPWTSDASSSSSSSVVPLEVRRLQVLSFAFGEMLRLNFYAKTRIALISPLWRGLCDISVPGIFQKGVLVEDALQALYEYLRNGWDRILGQMMMLTAISHNNNILPTNTTTTSNTSTTTSNNSNNNNLTVQVKLIGFLVARATHLIQTMMMSSSNHNHNHHHDTTSTTILSDVYRILLRLRGSELAFRWLFSQHNYDHSNNNNNNNTQNMLLLKTCQNIGTKVEKCLFPLLLGTTTTTTESTTTTTTARRHHTTTFLLDQLLLPIQANNQNHANTSTSNTSSSQLSHMGLVFGKVLLLQRYLSMASQQQHPPQQPQDDDDDWNHHHVVESMLSACENLITVALPQCYAPLLQTTTTTTTSSSSSTNNNNESSSFLSSILVTQSLQVLSTALNRVEFELFTLPQQPKRRIQYYRLLIRWMAPTTTTTTKQQDSSCQPQQQHPMTRELILSLLHMHIVRTSATANNNTLLFLSLLVKLLWDARTTMEVKSTLSALLIRLLATTTTTTTTTKTTNIRISETVQTLIEREWISLIEQDDTTNQRRKRKRRRGTTTTTTTSSRPFTLYDCADILEISKVLVELPQRKAPPQKLLLLLLSNEIQAFFGRSGGGAAPKVPTSSRASAVRYVLLLSYLQGTIQNHHHHHRHRSSGGGSSIQEILDGFRQASGGVDDVCNFQQSLIRSVLASKFSSWDEMTTNYSSNEQPFSSSSSKQKMIPFFMVVSSVLRFCTAACEVLGRNAKCIPFPDLCQLVANCTGFLRNDDRNYDDDDDDDLGSVQKLRRSVLFEATILLRSMGKAAPVLCSTKHLQVRTFLLFYSRQYV